MGREWLVRASNRWWKRKHLFSCDTCSLCHLILDLLFYLIHWLLCFENDFLNDCFYILHFNSELLPLAFQPFWRSNLWIFHFWAAKLKQVLQTEVYGKIFAIIPLQIEKEELNMAVVGEKSVSIKNLKLIFVLRFF